MTTGYRKRFVITTMTLLAVVLFVGFALLDVFMIVSDYHSLENTMQQVVEPWNAPGDNGRGLTDEEPPSKPDGEPGQDGDGGQPPEMPDGGPAQNDKNRGSSRQRTGDYNIVTVFYNFTDDTITMLTENPSISEETVRAVVPAIVEAEKRFSLLKDEGLIYYVDREGETCRIALTDSSTYTANAIGNTVVLALVYIGSLAVLFPICLRLSKVAAKPMENAIEMEREFVANISHDLKTPITVILANNSILKSNSDSKVAEQSQWIESTDSAAKNMMDMVGKMLTLSALESQEQTVSPERTNLTAAAEKSVLQLESIAFDRRITVDTEIEKGVFVLATKEYAERVCNSLLENALKYEPDGGGVYVRLTQEKKKAVLSVRNPGSTIAPEDLPHIFDRFYRADKARGSRGGHGLGLPIVKQIAGLIGATVGVHSDAASGTEFTVEFEPAKKA
ncbi:MAG: HAMP domain-containing histidine kinase [Clostridiales bacterium]|nr:HAMP domain-containing histidine kinase [Clostridiales bacterium]